MAKMFYSFDNGNLYHMTKRCDLKSLMHEQCTQNGVLIYATKGVFELVEYNGGREVECDTRIIAPIDGCMSVIRKCNNAKQNCKSVMQDNDADAMNIMAIISNVVVGE